MPLYHKRSKSRPSFPPIMHNLTSLPLDNKKNELEKPSVKAYSKSLADVLMKSAKSDENTDTSDSLARPLSIDLFSSPSDFEAVEISRIKTSNGKTVKSFTRVESSNTANTDGNIIKITPQSQALNSPLSDMLHDWMKSDVRLGQQMTNADDMVEKTNSPVQVDNNMKVEPKTQLSFPKTHGEGSKLKKTLSRFISKMNFLKNEPQTQQTNGFITQQSVPTQFSEKKIEKENIANLKAETITQQSNKSNAQRLLPTVFDNKNVPTVPRENDLNLKSKHTNENNSNIPKTISRELQEPTQQNMQLNQIHFSGHEKTKTVLPVKNNNFSKKTDENSIKNAKTKSRELQELTEQNIQLSKKYFRNLDEKKKRSTPKNNELVKQTSNNLDAQSSEDITRELEELTELNVRLSQEYFKNFEEQKKTKKRRLKKPANDNNLRLDRDISLDQDNKENFEKPKKIKKQKSGEKKLKAITESQAKNKYKKNNVIKKIKSKDSHQDEHKNLKKRKADKDIQNITKKLKSLGKIPKEPRMIHTSKHNMDRYKTDEFIDHMMQLQNERDVGIYVYCDSCDKIRYLADVKDPLDLPDKWYCHMNPDTEYNDCDAPDYEVPPEDKIRFIKNKFNAGSVVWAKLEGFPWWPAMVDDDPDTEDFYWLDHEEDEEPTWYHVTFFDTQKVTRAWIKTKNIEPFDVNCKNRLFLPRPNDIFKHRIESSVTQARDACNLELLPRLRKYGFITRYFNPKKGKKEIGEPKEKSKTVKVKPSFTHQHSNDQSKLKKPRKISKLNKIYSNDDENEILQDVDIVHFMNHDSLAEINIDALDVETSEIQ